MIRPTSMYYQGASLGENGCDFDSCSSVITAIANPLIWWGGAAAVGYLVYRFVRYREWKVGIILMGMVAGYVPWLMYLNRTVFQFYGIIFEPYMILAITFVVGLILRTKDDYKRSTGIAILTVLGIVAVLLSIFFYPLWTGMQIPYWYWHIHMWLPSWI